jgi:serine/threonine protein kinase
MADRVGQRIGDYLLIRLLGRGRFAEVYLGQHDVLYNKQAAIKILHTYLTDDDVANFRNEAEIISSLIHPHIVHLDDFGVEDGVPFLVMAYAPNGTLRERHPKGTILSLATIVSYIKQIAAAVQFAHDRRLIHRDIKPENMLLGPNPNNEVWLSDFGIAVIVHSSRLQTTQDVAGTWHYTAPEQFQGKPQRASDQYALGVIVYEWLCGFPPFQGSLEELYYQHRFVPPPALFEKVSTVSPDLEHVIMTALAKDPQKRFANVEAFATVLEQTCQMALSHPAALSTEIPLLSQPTPPTYTGTTLGTILYIYTGHSSGMRALAWSSDGKRIATASDDYTAQVWDALTGKHAITYHGHLSHVEGVAWSPNNTRIVSGSADGTVQIWDATTGTHIYTYHGHMPIYRPSAYQDHPWVNRVSWSPDGMYIVSCDQTSDPKSIATVQVWEVTTGKTVVTYRNHTNGVYAVAWSPDGKRIASAGYDRTLQIWDAMNGTTLITYKGNAFLFGLSWSPAGEYVAVGTTDNTVVVVDSINGKVLTTYQGHYNWVKDVAWSSDGKRIASGSDDGMVRLWDTASGINIYTYDERNGHINAVGWSFKGNLIASGGDTVQVWQAL